MRNAPLLVAVLVILVVVLLAVFYRPLARRETVIPRRVNTCSSAQNVLPEVTAPPGYPEQTSFYEWTGQNNHNWTVADQPWDPDTKMQLTAAALTAGARQRYLPINPLTRIGITDRVLNWDNPYGANDMFSNPCSDAVSIFDVQPSQPGFMEPMQNDSTDGTPAEDRYYYQPSYWNRASGPYGGPYTPVAVCPYGAASAVCG